MCSWPEVPDIVTNESNADTREPPAPSFGGGGVEDGLRFFNLKLSICLGPGILLHYMKSSCAFKDWRGVLIPMGRMIWTPEECSLEGESTAPFLSQTYPFFKVPLSPGLLHGHCSDCVSTKYCPLPIPGADSRVHLYLYNSFSSSSWMYFWEFAIGCLGLFLFVCASFTFSRIPWVN